MSSTDSARPWLPTSLPSPTRRELLTGSMVLGITAASVLLKPRRIFDELTQGELEAAIPTTVGDYRFLTTSGLVLPPRDELSDRLYDQVLTRVYAAPGKPAVMALMAYGSVQNLSLELHRPDECYPQQGFTITDPEPLVMELHGHSIPASILTARRASGYIEQVAFWSRIGANFPPDRAGQSLVVARENFAGRMPDGILVRLSVPTASREEGAATAKAFLADLSRGLSPVGQRILFGEAGREIFT
ncbi:exosortase C-terminal domain/associated protein EpsI [Novosphingobium sp. RD2P27]|uniref:Exosortase C-terminal domain/associated protein EpsI n=1 Tax=Novosphingobium kalidii TaxID=3230299 RepID=A0ABV2CYB2_9SPHN